MGKDKKKESTSNVTTNSRKVQEIRGREDETDMTQASLLSTRLEIGIASALFGCVFTVYVTSLYPSLPGGDSGELIVAAHELGVAHPPGYPLFTLLSKTFISLLPMGNVAWRVNSLSALMGSLSFITLYLLILKITEEKGAALLGAGFFAFGRLTWMWSISAEVFSLNNFLVSLLMLTAVDLSACSKEKKQKMCLIGSFLCGMCLSNQHTSVLYLMFLIPWALLHMLQNKLISFKLLVYITGTFLLGLSPYLYLPVSCFLHKARWTWGDQRSLQGFLTHLLRQEYGTWDLLKDHTGQGFAEGLRSYIKHLQTDFSLMIVGLFILCPITILMRRKTRFGGILVTFFLMLIFYISFFAWRANLDTKNPLFSKVVERFWMQADLGIIIFAALTYSDCVKILCEKVGMKRSYLDLALVIPLVTVQAYKSWPECNQRGNTLLHDFSLQALHAFPQDSIILTKGDLCSNSFRYFNLCEKVRPDLHIFDQEVLTYNWSLPMMKEFSPGIKFPGDFFYLSSGRTKDGRRAFTFKDLIDVNIKHHPIFACIGVQEHESSWQEAYTLRPFGVCWQIVKKDSKLDVDSLSQATASFTRHWPYNWTQEPDDGSWDYVANSEMWRAKTATAFYFLEQAISVPEGSDTSRVLLLKSYELYTSAIEAASDFPPYWHRNFAITCERLMRESTSLSQLDLVKKTVFHFKEFIRLEPSDADVPTIRNAVKTLSDYISNMEQGQR